jgi:translation initiation factor IF-1
VSHEADRITIDGEVIAVDRGSCRVRLENGHLVRAILGGKLMLHKIRVLPGDTVEVEVSAYDLSRGRIVRRHR